MKLTKRVWTMVICVMTLLLGAGHRLTSRPVHAQQSTQPPYEDGTFYINSYVDVDDTFDLYVDAYMDVDYDFYEEIDEIELDAYADEDDSVFDEGTDYGDDYDPAELSADYGTVPTGHEYGLESDGFACFEDDEGEDYGDCDWEYVGTNYGYVNVQYPPPIIDQLSPSSANQGDQNQLIISGRYLVQSSYDHLTLIFTGPNNTNVSSPFTLLSQPSSCNPNCSATYSYDLTNVQPGQYHIFLANDESSSDGASFTVNANTSTPPASPPPGSQYSCLAGLDSHSGFSGIIPTGTAVGGSGSVTVSFSGGSFNANTATVPYGQYSTPESIASHIAALITRKYSNSGLSAQSMGSYILYKGTSLLGNPNLSVSGSTYASDTSTACPPANLKYVLVVQSDTVVWQQVPNSNQRGRQPTYELAYWPSSAHPTFNSLSFPSFTTAMITEHLTKNGYTSSNSGDLLHSGQFADVLGNADFTNTTSGIFMTERWFSLILNGGQVPGSIMTLDTGGKHAQDHIEIHLPNGPSFLNYDDRIQPNGVPKDRSIP